jgi:hypothetical protein
VQYLSPARARRFAARPSPPRAALRTLRALATCADTTLAPSSSPRARQTVIGVLLTTQSEFISHIPAPDEASTNVFLAAALFYVLTALCVACIVIVFCAKREGTLRARLAGYGSINRKLGGAPGEDAPLLGGPRS